LWPFNHFRKPRNPSRGTIEAIYGMIVTQARERLFYRELGVPDTVNGRFDMLVLHLWMVLRRLKPTKGGGAGVSQALFDYFCDETAVACLAGLDDAALQSGSWRFPSPARVSVQQ